MAEAATKHNNIYEKMEFPDYEYRPYPRLVYDAAGNWTKVENEAEETALRAKFKAAAPAVAAPAPVGVGAVASVKADLGKAS